MVRTRGQRARDRNTPKRTGVVRNPLLKKGFTPQVNTLFEHGFEETPKNPGGFSPNIAANAGGGETLDFGQTVKEPEVAMPMALQDGHVAVLEGLQTGQFDVNDLQRIDGQNEMAAGAGAGFGGAAYLILLRRQLFGPISAAVGGAAAVVFGLSYLIGDSDAQMKNIESFEVDQETRWRKWEAENQISRADIFQYAVTDYQIKALQEAGGGYTLAKDWYKYSPGHVVTEADVLEVEVLLEAKISAAPSPPDYIPPPALDTMKNNAWKMGVLPMFFTVLLILWRRRKKKRRR